jgi:hypothetical protein
LAALDGEEAATLLPLWGGMLHEFRNHLMLLLAGTAEIRIGVPRVAAADLAPTLDSMEASLQSFSALASWIEAAIRPGQQVISDLDDVIDRALNMAKPWIRSDVEVSIGQRRGAVRNRNGAVECALAALIADFARPVDTRPEPGGRKIQIDVFAGRGLLAIEIESNASRPAPLSWRYRLAERLAATVAGTLEPLPQRVGVCLKFQ